MTPRASALDLAQAAQAWRAEQWVRELDEAIVRTVFEALSKGALAPRLHRALHDYAGKTALRQLRVQVLAHLSGRRLRRSRLNLVSSWVAEDRHVADLFDTEPS